MCVLCSVCKHLLRCIAWSLATIFELVLVCSLTRFNQPEHTIGNEIKIISNEKLYQFKINFDHLFQSFETPFSFISTFQLKDLLKTEEGCLRFILFESFAVVVLVFKIDIWFSVTVFRVFLCVIINFKISISLDYLTNKKCSRRVRVFITLTNDVQKNLSFLNLPAFAQLFINVKIYFIW